LKTIKGNLEIKELQKIAMFGIAYIIQKVLMKSTEHSTWAVTLHVP